MLDLNRCPRHQQGPRSYADPRGSGRLSKLGPPWQKWSYFPGDPAPPRGRLVRRGWDADSVRNGDTGKPIALRYIIMHLIEETARHNGHLDVLRELADGITGD